MKRPAIGYLSRVICGDRELIDQVHLYTAAEDLGYVLVVLVYADHDTSAARLMNYVWAERAEALITPTTAHLDTEAATAIAKQTSIVYVDSIDRPTRHEQAVPSHLSLVRGEREPRRRR
ncbi:hypothetical protein [Nocardia yamanashiensis]|uniref:hypothetical protein n=1 Tax=Nocardia yamanashiensis TaxID=209247 RepID=UPI000830E2CB|nr:hypothetical protein [Nocardia yamanashiensis]